MIRGIQEIDNLNNRSAGTVKAGWRKRNKQAWTAAYIVILLSTVTVVCPAQDRNANRNREAAEQTPAVLWVAPVDIHSRNLFYGPGGKDHAPHTTYTFVGEDPHGTNPKFDVRDENGVKWRVKLGPEARPETVASRLLWAVGYFSNEDYFLSELRVENMPQLKRHNKVIGSDGTMQNVRLKRHLQGEEKIGNWQWRKNPFAGTREFNGLRVMMALINNWDLKDENNSVVEEKGSDIEFHYMVSDLGSSFSATGHSYPDRKSKGNLPAYRQSKFIRRVNQQSVDFDDPARPHVFYVISPKMYIRRLHMRWIGRDIPRGDAKWIGELLSQLSRDQIRDAFRAAGYSPAEVEQFSNIVEKRIAELQNL